MDELNSTESHLNLMFPSINDYYTDIEIFTILTIAFGALFFLISNLIFFRTLSNIFKCVRTTYRWETLALCIIYPIVALMALLTILIPTAGLICSSVMHATFTICAYVFYRLLFKYVGGEKSFIKEVSADSFNLRTPPCCCCCICFSPVPATLDRISAIRFMILQLPIVQIAILIAINIIYFVDFNIYTNVSLYFIPFIIISILIGLWGLNILVRLIAVQATNHKLMLKYVCIQLVLVFCKLQPAVLEGVFTFIDFPSKYPLTKNVYRQSIIQIAILAEMMLLSILAQKAYRKPESV